MTVVCGSAPGAAQLTTQRLKRAGTAAGAEVRVRCFPDTSADGWLDSGESYRPRETDAAAQAAVSAGDVLWADIVVFGVHTGSSAEEIARFVETLPRTPVLSAKVYAGFLISRGSPERHKPALSALYNRLHQLRGVVVSPGRLEGGDSDGGLPDVGRAEAIRPEQFVRHLISIAMRTKRDRG